VEGQSDTIDKQVISILEGLFPVRRLVGHSSPTATCGIGSEWPARRASALFVEQSFSFLALTSVVPVASVKFVELGITTVPAVLNYLLFPQTRTSNAILVLLSCRLSFPEVASCARAGSLT
jgi:hypothetical protein